MPAPTPVPAKFKISAAVVCVIAALVHLWHSGYREWTATGNTVYVLLLLGLFFSRETIEDERIRTLKLKALTVAFMLGYTVAYVAKLTLRFYPDLPRVLSAYDLMFVMLATAFGLFHYWQYRDGRDPAAGHPA
jgi:hypothetical protein